MGAHDSAIHEHDPISVNSSAHPINDMTPTCSGFLENGQETHGHLLWVPVSNVD